MRIGVVAVAVISLACASCGNSKVSVATPSAEAQDELNGLFTGRLLLDDGRRLEISDGRLLGPWICGSRRGMQLRAICVEAVGVTAVEHDEYRMGVGARVMQVIALVALAPTILVWTRGKLRQDRESRAAAEEFASRRGFDDAIEAGSGKAAPPLPTQETYRRDRAYMDLWNCSGVETVRRKDRDGEPIARDVWNKRETCLDEAAQWFVATGQIDKARRLEFIHWARRRHELLACGGTDPGLLAPQQEVVGPGDGRWMDEYRAVVGDPDTYDYATPDGYCGFGSAPQPQSKRTPNAADRAAATAQVISSFPLTDTSLP